MSQSDDDWGPGQEVDNSQHKEQGESNPPKAEEKAVTEKEAQEQAPPRDRNRRLGRGQANQTPQEQKRQQALKQETDTKNNQQKPDSPRASQLQKPAQKKQEKVIQSNQADNSWDADSDKKSQKKESKAGGQDRGDKNKQQLPNNSLSVAMEANKEKVIVPDLTNWDDDDQKPEDKKEVPVQRGNRGRGNREENNDNGGGFRKRDDGQFRGNRNFEEGGFRGGRNSDRGGFRGNPNNYDRGGFRNNRNEDGNNGNNRNQEGYRGNRGNRDENQGSNFGNREGRGGYRGRGGGGYRGNREQNQGRGGGGGYRGNRPEEGGYNNNRNGDARNFNNGGNRNQNRGGYGRNDQNDRQGERPFNRDPQINNESQQQKAQIQPIKKMNITPNGRKSWPQSCIFIFDTKFSISFRKIDEYEADVIMIPYYDMKLNLYPGNIINKCRADYRKKIDAKEQNKKVGSVYVQKCMEIENFKAFAFTRVGQQNENKPNSEAVKKGLEKLLDAAAAIKVEVKSVLIPYCKELCSSEEILEWLIDGLQKNSEKYGKIKEVTITSNNKEDFINLFQSFEKMVLKMIEGNQINALI